MTEGFRKTGERSVYDGYVISLAVGTFESPDGETFDRDIVHHPGAVAAVPLLDDGVTALLVRQYRAAPDRLLLELPAGKLDIDGEAPEVAVGRELVEEIGRKAGSIVELGRFYNSPGFCDEIGIVYLARDLTEVPNDLQGPEESHMTIEPVSLHDVPAMVADARLLDAKTIIGLFLARETLGLR